ncbi:MAG: S-layer protein domain-containing protein [Methanosarcina sp.]
MHVPSKPGKKENKEIIILSLFSSFLLVSLFFLNCTTPALAISNEEKLSVILINGGEIYVKSGNSYTFFQDYELYVKSADPGGKKIWIELRREGVLLKDAVVNEGSVFVYSDNSSEIFNLTVSTIYEGADGVLVKFSPVYQYLDPKLPAPRTGNSSQNNSTEDNTSNFPGFENQAEGFDLSTFLLGLGAVLIVSGFFAGKRQKK